MNAWIGSCCLVLDKEKSAELAWQLVQNFDNAVEIKPDLVTLCLKYSALSLSPNHDLVAREVLERAHHLAKKEGGS
jgi:hypothetical protein